MTQNTYACKVCEKEKVAGFAVKDDLWEEVAKKAGLEDGKGTLCLDCFEKTLGRQITWEDLKLSTTTKDGVKICPPINYWLVEKLMGQAPEQQLNWVSGWLTDSYEYYRKLWLKKKKDNPNEVNPVSGQKYVDTYFENSRNAAFLLCRVWEEIERREDE